MRAAGILILVAVALALFALWGLFTAAGSQAFDEMSGMIPFFAGVLSPVFAVAAIIAWWIAARRRALRLRQARRQIDRAPQISRTM